MGIYRIPTGDRYISLFHGDTDVKFFIFIKPDLPFHKESIESWIKLLEDIGKTALLAMLPLFWLNSYSLTERASGVVVLALVAYFCKYMLTNYGNTVIH
jgi:hypothetical protein